MDKETIVKKTKLKYDSGYGPNYINRTNICFNFAANVTIYEL